ncbi:MAG: DNA-3-methyladenine glycosylase 2 family protein [Oscillospiraceae bacterium]|nr:DNA-3-methyladenine glycosylase 2 family protein [Oscillospiraceae bacterium]
MYKKIVGKNIEAHISEFDLEETLDCGQCFRWKKLSDDLDTTKKVFEGIIYDRCLKIIQIEKLFIFEKIDELFFDTKIVEYFDLKTNYKIFNETFKKDKTINKALNYAKGIRIVKQDSWEVICSFIISQNNNISRIKGIIENLCKSYGKKISEENYTFPSPEVLEKVSLEKLMEIKAGFRCKYILDACKMVVSGELLIDKIDTMDIDEARKSLMRVKGIGPKVADCILLFGFYRLEAFPIDVWIKRALDYFYPNGFPEEYVEFGGVAQQYIFHYIRTCPDAIPAEYKKNRKKTT